MKTELQLVLYLFVASILLERRVSANCNGETWSSAWSGQLTHVFTGGYQLDTYCIWGLGVYDGVIKLSITMDIYKDEILPCSAVDYLRIVNYHNETDVWADYLCGSDPFEHIGSSAAAKVFFNSSSNSGGGTGFTIEFEDFYPDVTTSSSSSSSSEATTTEYSGIFTLPPGSSGSFELTTIIIIIVVAVIAGVILFPVIIYLIVKCCCSKTDSQTRVMQAAVAPMPPVHSQTTSRYPPPPYQATDSLPLADPKFFPPSLDRKPPVQSKPPIQSKPSTWKLGDDLAPAPVKPKEPVKPVVKAKQILPHVMISYQWDVKTEVLKFRKKLGAAGYRVWIDVEQMHKSNSTFESMASAVDHSVAVIPVLTQKYQESINCRKEIEFADKRKKPLIPIRLEEDFEMAPWLEFLIGTTHAHNLCSRKTYTQELKQCLDALSVKAQAAKEIAEETVTPSEEG